MLCHVKRVWLIKRQIGTVPKRENRPHWTTLTGYHFVYALMALRRRPREIILAIECPNIDVI